VFSGFPSVLRKHGLQADVRTILHLYTLMSRGLVKNLGGLYSFGERLVVKDPREKGPYTVAFFAHFLDIHIASGQTLDDAVIHSDAFAAWRRQNASDRIASPQLVDEFLESVLNKTPDIKGLAEAIQQQRGSAPEIDVPFFDPDEVSLDTDVDHSDKDLDELIRRMLEIAEQQNEAHRGGKKYVGTGGTSPYGHAGRSSAGIRVGGRSAHLSARLVLNDPHYFPLNMNAILSDNNIDAAFAALKGVAEHSSHLELDLDETIRMGARRGGLFIPHLTRKEDEQLNVMLFIDNGGFSMDPYIPVVRALFQKMKTRFDHDLRIFYFHNIIDSTVHSDQARTAEPIPLESLLREGKHQRVFIVGDASMAPYELHGSFLGSSGFDCLRDMAAAFPRLVWLNPVREGSWGLVETIDDIRSVIKMFPLTPRGIEKAVTYLNQAAERTIAYR
jgi:uncharacterized protein with von Willebrand factor type A (vWA) domain